MSRKKDRSQPNGFELARDELFSHIHRCGVLKATDEQQKEWMDDTIDFLGERYPELSQAQLDELRSIGTRFCKPVIATRPETDESASADEDAEVAAA